MNYLNQPKLFRNLLVISVLFFAFTNLYSQQSVECNCPEGGKFKASSILPSNITGEFASSDRVIDLNNSCWDFGNKDQVPDNGLHYYDIIYFQVSESGDYSFTGFDNNKLMIALFKELIYCEYLVIGMGGYVGDSTSLYFEEPQNNGVINNTIRLEAQNLYLLVISDYDSKYIGSYDINIISPTGAEVMVTRNVYSDKCDYYGCYDANVDYNFPMPKIDGSLVDTITWKQTESYYDFCGTQIITRNYTIKDTFGFLSYCTSEYYFRGNDLIHLSWPKNWDGLYDHNPMLECNSGYLVDVHGNPDPISTEAPEGYNKKCGTIEVFYNDQVFNLICGTKILRTWTLVDDCTGGVYEHIQVIRITDNIAPTFMALEDIRFKTKPYKCSSDIEVPTIQNLVDNCDSYPKWYVTTTAGVLVGDDNFNGFVDINETWKVLNVPIGTYEICYHAIDSCGNTSETCADIVVFDIVRPIAECEHNKDVLLKTEGEIKLYAHSFDSGSFDNCKPVHFKALRVNDNMEYDGGCENLNGDDDSLTTKTEVWYDDDIYFCCEDIDEEVKVLLRVFDLDPGLGPVDPQRMAPNGDLYGSYNDCLSKVNVSCSFLPELDCSDVSVSCEESLDPEENPRLKIYVEEGCNIVIDYEDERNEDCGNIVTRTWTAKECGKLRTCEQIITISDSITPIDPCTIVFPKDTTVNCVTDATFDSKPIWEGGACHNVTVEIIQEDTLLFVDGDCSKIVREWQVIDWCTYNGDAGFPNKDSLIGNKLDCDELIEDGTYRYSQTLFVRDTIAPTITLEDQCIATTDCYAYEVELEAKAKDICNLTQKFDWKYIITNMDTWETIQYSYNYTPTPSTGRKGKRSKDLLDKTANGKILILDPLPVGYFRVIWTAKDGCGNTTSKKQFFRIADNTAPTPIMVDIATAVMESGIVELKARTFDKGGCDFGCLSSVDNCTPKSGLYFTFSDKIPHFWENQLEWAKQRAKYGKYFFDPETGLISSKESYLLGKADAWIPTLRTSQRLYNCDFSFEDEDYFSKTIQVFVFDKFDDSIDNCDDNNFDFENVIVNFNRCSGKGSNIVEGTVKTPNRIPFTGLELKTVGNTGGKYTISENGKYFFELEKGSYQIKGTYNKDYLNGVSTADLIHMYRNMLGLEKFGPLKQIAASISGYGFVNTLDFKHLQNLLIRKEFEFPNDSWIAISDNYNFDNFSYNLDLEKAKIQNIILDDTNLKDVNFTVVKIGDVDFSANLFPPTRIDRKLTFEVENKKVVKGEEMDIPFYAKNFKNIWGLQFTMDISGLNIVKIIPGYISLYKGNYNVFNNNLLVTFRSLNKNVDDGDLLFTLRVLPTKNTNVKDILTFNDKYLRSEAYYGYDLEVDKISLDFKKPTATIDLSSEFKLFQNEPNPFSNRTTIGFNLPHASSYKLTIYDLTGKEISSQIKKDQGKEGYNSIIIDKNDFPSRGMYIYKLESEKYIAVKKMLIQ